MILRPLPALAALLTLVGPAAAQAPKPPAPATLEQIERLEAGPRRRDFYLSPQAAESARACGGHGQWFGLPPPVDAVAGSARLLAGRPVTAVAVRSGTADLDMAFEGGAELELFNDSISFEDWAISAADGFQVVAVGGGQIALWDARKPPAGVAP